MIFAPAYAFDEVSAFSLIENVKHYSEIKDSDKNVTMCVRSLPIDGIEVINHRIKNNLPIKYLLDFSRETFNINVFNLIFSQLPPIDQKNILIIHNESDIRSNTVLPEGLVTLPLNFYLLETYVKCILGNHEYDKSLIVERNGGLNLLIGKLKVRVARFLTTYYFYKHDLFRNAVLGINCYEEDILGMMQAHPQFYDLNYFTEIKKYLGPADITNVHETNEGITVNGGWPFDPLIFKNSQVSYICETYDERHYPFLETEKFYRAIVNKHPFIIQACSGQLDMIRSLGYLTFSDIIDESYNTYDSNHDFGYIEKTVVAAKELLTAIPKNVEKLQEIVNFNFDMFCEKSIKALSSYRRSIMEFDQNS